MRRAAVVFFTVLLLAFPASAQRRHVVRPPAVSDATPAGWLANHAYRDVESIRNIVGTSIVIGLGDDTHGTHEFFETRLRMIQVLVREKDFTTVAFEAPFADFNRLNDYVLGGGGDPRIILLHRELGYWMWASDEIVDAIEWIRHYNGTRGDRPAVEIAGFDVTDDKGAEDIAIAYLNSVDPGSTTQDREAVRSNLIAHEGEFVSRSSQRAFDTALQGATVAAAALKAPSFLLDYFAWRDQNMAANAVQLQRRRSSNGRVIVWGHQEHLGKTINLQNAKPMGKWLDDQFGHDYFVIGSSAGDGVFNVLDPLNQRLVITAQFPPMSADAYESNFRSAAIPVMLIPLRIELPDWLATPHDLRGGSSNMAITKKEDLKQKLDAIIYIDQTTRSNTFW